MKVVILCGGMGTRMREETEFRPKPMVTVGGRPILWHIMKMYAHYGLNEFILCLGYKGEVIKEYFYNYSMLNNDLTVRLGRNRGAEIHATAEEEDWAVTLVNTGDRTLKGGRLKRVEKYVTGDTFMLTYGDGVADVDLRRLLEFHRQHGKLGTVTGVHPPSLFGELQVSGGKALLFSEKPQTSTGLISGGFFVFHRKVFDYLSEDEGCDFERGPLEKVAADGELMVYVHAGFWACMDTFRDVEHLNGLWRNNQAHWKVWR